MILKASLTEIARKTNNQPLEIANENHGHRNAETAHARATADVYADGSSGYPKALSGREDGAVLAPRQQRGGHLSDDRRLGKGSRRAAQSNAARRREPSDLRADASWTAHPAWDADHSRNILKARSRLEPTRPLIGIPIRAALAPRYRPTGLNTGGKM